MKKLVLGLLLVLFVGLSAGATLEDFDYVYDDGFEVDLTGGEALSMGSNFTNAADREVPLGVEITVEGEQAMSDSGEEFDITGSLANPGGEKLNGLKQVDYKSTSEGLGVYRFRLENDGGVPGGRHSLNLELDSNVRIRPDTYSFDFSIRSVVGFGETENVTVDAGTPETVSFNDTGSSVTLNSTTGDVKVNVTQLSSVTVSPPQSGDEFVGGFTVDKEDENRDLSGAVTVRYDDEALDSRSLGVYYYNDSESSWQDIGGTQYEDNNTVVAEVDHFSTYATFAEDNQEGDSSSDGSVSLSATQSNSSSTEEAQNTDNQTQDQNQTDTQQEDQVQNQTQTEEQDSVNPEQNQEQPEKSNTITGQFLGSPTNIAGIMVALIVAMIGFLEYTGKIELYAIVERIREKLEDLR